MAHPDDETIGIGAQLARLKGVLIVHLTNGAPTDMTDARALGFANRAAYARARRAELAQALEAGGASATLVAFEVDDQDAANHLVAISRRLAALFARYRTEVALTHPYEGGHPDHDAAAFTVRAAAALAPGEVDVGEMAFYHAGAAGVVTQRFPDASPASPAAETALDLDDAAWGRKQRMLAAFATQGGTLTAFDARTERLRSAPVYDFTALPNRGRLHYETFTPWRGDRWRAAARTSLAELARQAAR